MKHAKSIGTIVCLALFLMGGCAEESTAPLTCEDAIENLSECGETGGESEECQNGSETAVTLEQCTLGPKADWTGKQLNESCFFDWQCDGELWCGLGEGFNLICLMPSQGLPY